MAGNIYDWSLTPANNSNADGDINWTENQLPSTVNNSARQLMARIAEMLLDQAPVRVSSGAANVYAITVQSVLTAYDNGLVVSFRAHQANTGAAQINVNGLGLKPLRTVTATALLSGAIALNQCLSAVYVSTTDEFLIFSGALDATKVPLAGGTMTGILNLVTRSVFKKDAGNPDDGGAVLLEAPTNGGLGAFALEWYSDGALYLYDTASSKGVSINTPAIPAAQFPELWHRLNVASQAEAEAGTENTKGTTSLRVAQHVDFRIASQAEMEAASSLTKLVTPGRQHFHPSAAKAWFMATVSGGVPSLAASYNITSISDNGAGLLGVTIATDFSSANWAGFGATDNASSNSVIRIFGKTAGAASLDCINPGTSTGDPGQWNFVAFGDL